MKKLSLLFTAALCFGLAHAQLAVENFDYDAGAELAGGAGGSGWDGPWVFQNATTSLNTIVAGSLEAAGRTSTSGYLEVDHTGGQNNRYFRRLATPQQDVAGQQVWMSMFMDSDYAGEAASNGTVHFMGFANSADYGSTGPGGQLMFIGRQFNQANIAAVRIPTNAVLSEEPANELSHVVTALCWSGDDSPERVFVWINPPAGATSLDTANADIARNAPDLNGGFDAIGGKTGGGGALLGRVDDIRVATCYEELTGAGECGDGGGGGGEPNATTYLDDDIDAGNFVYLGYTNSFSTTQVSGSEVGIVGNGGGDNFENLVYQLNTGEDGDDDGNDDPVSIDLSATNKIFIRAKSTSPVAMRVDVVDEATDYSSNTPGLFRDVTAEYQTFEFDYSNALTFIDYSSGATTCTPASGGCDVPADAIDQLWFYLNPGSGSFDGTLTIDYIAFGEDRQGGGGGGGGGTSDALASENFNDYGVGDMLAGKDGGTGWSGAWTLAEGGNDSSVIVDKGLPIDELNVITSAPALRLNTSANEQRFDREFASPLTHDDGDFWFANQLTIDGALNTVANVTLLNADTVGGGNPERLFVGKRFGNREIFAAGAAGGGPTNAGKQFNGSDAAWIVNRVVAMEADSMWALYTWVNPNPADGTPDTANADIKGKMYKAAQFDAVRLKTEAAPGFRAEYDDLYFGRMFSDIVPADLTAIPAAGMAAEEGYDYDAGTALEGLSGGEGWAGDWEILGGEGSAEIAAGGVTSLPLLRQTASGHVAVTDALTARRQLNAEFGDYGRSYWVGFWTVSEGDFAGNVSRLVLASEAFDGSATAGQGELVQIGKGFGADNIGFAGGAAAPGAQASRGNFVVAEVVTNGTDAMDEVYVWVNPALDMRPGRDSAISQMRDLSGWEYIGLKVGGAAGLTTRWDDIYTGRSFGEIVPDDLEEVQDPGQPVAAVETFDYDSGAALAGLDGGSGWLDAWSVDGTATATITDGSLDSDRVDETGNALSMSKTEGGDVTVASRPFFAPFGAEGQDSSSVWVSFLHQQPTKAIGAAATVGIGSGDAAVTVGSRQGVNTVNITSGSDAPVALAGSAVGTTAWIVMRFEVSGNDSPEAVRVWVNPPADAVPSDASAAFTDTDLDGFEGGIEELRLRTFGTGAVDLRVDEFRIGFGYRDISTGFGNDNANLVAAEPFNFDAGASLPGLGGENPFWAGAWELAESSDALGTNTATIVSGSLDGAGVETSGNRVEVSLADAAQKIRVERDFSEPITVADGNETWVSFLMNTTQPDFFSNVSVVMLMASGSSFPNGGEALGFGRRFDAAAGPLGVVFPGAGAVSSEVADAGLNLVTARILSLPDGDNDLISLWINPDVNSASLDTAEADLNLFRPRLRDVELTGVRLKVEAAGPADGYVTEFDEIRVARDFQNSIGMLTSIREPLVNDRLRVAAYPVPVSEELRIDWNASAAGAAEITVMDQQGRLISRVLDEPRLAGENSTLWYPNGDVANGVYYLVVRQGAESSVRKLVMLR